VKNSLSHWDKNSDSSAFVLISSGGIYKEDNGGEVDEESGVRDDSNHYSDK